MRVLIYFCTTYVVSQQTTIFFVIVHFSCSIFFRVGEKMDQAESRVASDQQQQLGKEKGDHYRLT